MNWLKRLRAARPDAPPPSSAARAVVTHWQALPEPDLGQPHFDTRYVVVNTEATGLDLERDRLLAVAAIVIDGGLIDPNRSYYARLDDDPAAALAGLLEICGKAPLVVFNTGFNRVALERAWAQWLDVTPAPLWLDLFWLLPAVFHPALDGPTRLAQWMKIFGIETFQRHHALGDAWAIAQLFIALQGRALHQGASTPRALGELERTRRQFTSPA
jgi:DNA polymerase-3 subunit epsilon